jgi:DNA-binding ferritin-like protein
MRKIGGTTIRSIGHSAKLQRVADNDADFVTPEDMQAELREDDLQLTQRMRETDDICDEHGDVASASLLENWIDQVERRVWFLSRPDGIKSRVKSTKIGNTPASPDEGLRGFPERIPSV